MVDQTRLDQYNIHITHSLSLSLRPSPSQHPQTCCDLPVISPSPPARCHNRRWRCHAARCPRPGKTGSCPDQTDRVQEGRDLHSPPDILRTCWSKVCVAARESRAIKDGTLLLCISVQPALTHILPHVTSVRQIPPMSQMSSRPVPVQLGVQHRVELVLHLSSASKFLYNLFFPSQQQNF